MESVDVVIVGSRCAGSTAAAAFARLGRKVVVLDKATFPSETLSSHTMFAPAIDELKRMGAWDDVVALNPPKLRHVHFEISSEDGERATYFESLAPGTEDMGTSIQRIHLDELLVKAARRAGADVREGCTVTDLRWTAGRAAGVTYVDPQGALQTIQAKLVIGADGWFSTVAELVGSGVPYRFSHTDRAAVYRYLEDSATGSAATTVYFWHDEASQGFAFPTTPANTIIAMFIADKREVQFARSDPEAYWESKLDEHPGASERLRGLTPRSPLRIAENLSGYFRKSSGPGWALVGDAGHFKDPVIGQGMRDALRGGRMVAEHVEPHLDDPTRLDAALREWERERDRECRLAYLLAVHESRMESATPGMVSMIGALSALNLPLAQALSGRSGESLKVLTPGKMLKAAVIAVRTSERPVSCARDLMKLTPVLAKVVRSARQKQFRDHRWINDFENTDGGWAREENAAKTRDAGPAPLLESVGKAG